ncbi:MAG TPA: AsmA family protein [Nitrospira sp.]
MTVLIRIGIVLLLLGLVLVLLPFLIDLNQYQDQYRPLIEAALNRKISLKDIRLTLLPHVGVRLSDFSIQDDPTFSADSFASLSSLDVRARILPLLIGHVEIDEIVLKDPIITLVKNKKGLLNVSTVGKAGTAEPSAPAPESPAHNPFGALGLDHISLTNGRVAYRDLSAGSSSAYTLQELNAELRNVHLGQTASLHLTASLQPLRLPITVDGTFGPLSDPLSFETLHMQLVSGQNTGAILIPLSLSPKKPLTIQNVQLQADVNGREARLLRLAFDFFQGQFTAQGGATLGSESPPFNGKAALQGVQLGPLMKHLDLPHVWVSGTGAGELSVQGRGFSKLAMTRSLKGGGHLMLKDGRIEGINLLQEAMGVLEAAGFSQDMAKFTIFSTIESDFEMSQGRIQVKKFRMECPGFDATATGTVGFDQTLNLKTSITLSEALSKKIAGTSRVVKIALTDGRMMIPLVITGTTQAPSFGLDADAIKNRAAEQAKSKALEAASGFLSKTFQKGSDALKKFFGN